MVCSAVTLPARSVSTLFSISLAAFLVNVNKSIDCASIPYTHPYRGLFQVMPAVSFLF